MDPLAWVIISICILLHFFFSASETALASANKFKFQIKADEGSKTSKLVLKVCDKYERALSTVLICSNVVSIVASSVSTIAFYNLFISLGMNLTYISLISSIIISLLIYVFGDALAKTIAKLIPDTISYVFIYPVYGLMMLLFPINFIMEKFSKLGEKIIPVEKDEEFNQEDFEDVVEQVSDEGIIDEEQGDLIQSALDFADTKVKEVLTSRDKVFAIDINNLDRETLHNIITNSSFSRVPVYKGNFDNVIGVLNIKRYFKEYMRDNNVKFAKTLQKPYFVSPDVTIDDLFDGFKRRKTHMAIVRDKTSKILGIITMDDILEELVSDINEVEKGGGK